MMTDCMLFLVNLFLRAVLVIYWRYLCCLFMWTLLLVIIHCFSLSLLFCFWFWFFTSQNWCLTHFNHTFRLHRFRWISSKISGFIDIYHIDELVLLSCVFVLCAFVWMFVWKKNSDHQLTLPLHDSFYFLFHRRPFYYHMLSIL